MLAISNVLWPKNVQLMHVVGQCWPKFMVKEIKRKKDIDSLLNESNVFDSNIKIVISIFHKKDIKKNNEDLRK